MAFSDLRAFIIRYQHQLSIGSFFVGFTIDTIILKRIDLLISNLLLFTYLSVVILSMVLLHYAAAHPPRREWWKRVHLYIPFVAQFAFGGMFSGFLIFYSQAGSVIASWPFLLIIVGLLFGNEFLRNYQQRLTYQSLLLFFCFFSFSIYALPIFLGRMGDDVFELSGGAALLLIALFLYLLSFIDHKRVQTSLWNIILGSFVIYGLITALYFSNTLPPIPLALKDIGVYHSIERSESDYVATGEPAPWYARYTGVEVHLRPNDVLYAYSSVFAPTNLATSVVHEWQYYDELRGEWVTEATIPFPISGGRDGGYRGYTTRANLRAGLWRINVETARGQLIGREVFTVIPSSSTPALTTRILR
ncbi:MAG: DUF2914 domain-containing protein [Patescibacteria group bacterium]